MRKALLLSLLIIGILIFGCGGGPARKSCKTDEDCESWRQCNTTAGFCIPKAGYCETDSACGETRACSPEHKCELKLGLCENSTDCADWQTCDSVLGKCMPRIGYCIDDGFCQAWERCNNDTHMCIPGKNRCVDSFDCEPHQLCNESSRLCYPLPGRCDNNESCEKWQYCDMKKKNCILKPGLCGADSDCKSGEYCDSNSYRCLTRKLTEEEKIIKLVSKNETPIYTLKEQRVWDSTTLPRDKLTGDIAEIPLEKGKNLFVINCNATKLDSISSGNAQMYPFALVDPGLMSTIAKGEDMQLSTEDLVVTSEPRGFVRIDDTCTGTIFCPESDLIFSVANWHQRDSKWKPGTRMNFSDFAIKSGDAFKLIVEFDQREGAGSLNIYVENRYGRRTKISGANYTTYKNGDGKDSVAALVGGKFSPGAGKGYGISLIVGSMHDIATNYSTYAPGQCSKDGECEEWESCNPITHSCVKKAGWCTSNEDCPNGFKCNTALGPGEYTCIPKACGHNADCPGSTCDIEMHLCRPSELYCSPDNYTCYEEPRYCVDERPCAPWERCEFKVHMCVTRMGMCGSDHDCPLNTRCDFNSTSPTAHTCIPSACSSDSDCQGSTCDTANRICRQVTT